MLMATIDSYRKMDLRYFSFVLLLCFYFPVNCSDCHGVFPGISTFGTACHYQCHCVGDLPCNNFGQCSDGCSYGWMGPGCQYRNVATHFKRAKQVGPNTNENQQPENAVDGRHQTCSETSIANYAGRHFWSVELEFVHEVIGLRLSLPENNLDLFKEFRIEMGPSNTNFSDLCYEHPNVSGTTTMEITCSRPVKARSIRIKLKLEDVQLRLCEVEIYGGRQVSFNVATKQSTTFSKMVPEKAVDGRFVTADDIVETIEASTCSATNGNENNPWWYIDLQQQYKVQAVDFYGRLSSTEESRGFHISIGSSPSITQDIFVDDPTSVNEGYQPRRVILQQPLNTKILKIDLRPYNTIAQLSICELHIFADCEENKCGWDCDIDCYCKGQITGTRKINGTCPYGCSGRWTGVNGACDTECDIKKWGERCQNSCGNCLDSFCDVQTGKCEKGCGGNWIPPMCTQLCLDGSFGANCKSQCGNCLNNAPCEKENGTCQHGCDLGWQGRLCDNHCADGMFGHNCSSQCGRCKDSKPCDPVHGVCAAGCHTGFMGPHCDIDLNLITRIKNETTIRISSVYSNWNAERVIDGLFVDNPDICQCCAGTQNDALSWLEIDLGNMYPVASVTVYGRTNENVFDQMTGFNLYLTNDTADTNEPVYSNSIITGDMVQITSLNILTRFLKFDRPGKLTICEVQIIEGECQVGYFGNECSKQCHCADGKPCDRHSGTCVTQICDIGFTGASCSEECMADAFGKECSRQCHCIDGQSCSKDHGICPLGCAEGFEGDHCEHVCHAGTFGKNCANDCGNCLNGKSCDHVSGKCVDGCHPGFDGPLCRNAKNLIQRIKADTRTEMSSTYNDWSSERAIDNNIGPNPHQCKCCSSTLNEAVSWWRIDLGKIYPLNRIEVFGRLKESDYQHTNGFKMILKNNSDEQGHTAYVNRDDDDEINLNITVSNHLAKMIEIERPGKLTICELKAYEGDCPLGKYGDNCGQSCHCADGKACGRTNGRCLSPACSAGWTGQACSESCAKDFYGQNCSMRCGLCKDSETCDHKNGICHNGCANGFNGVFCTNKVSCQDGYYGQLCASKCGECKDLETCHSETGLCLNGCAPGYTGPLCNSKDEIRDDVSNTAAVGSNTVEIEEGTSGGMIALYIVLSLIAVGFGGGGGVTIYCRCRKRRNSDSDDVYAELEDGPQNSQGDIKMNAIQQSGSNNNINIYTTLPSTSSNGFQSYDN